MGWGRSRSGDNARARRVRGALGVVLAGSLLVAAIVFAVEPFSDKGGLPGIVPGTEEDFEGGEENDIAYQRTRRKAYLSTRLDPKGNPRPDLWRRGIRRFENLPISAAWPLQIINPPRKAAAKSEASEQAPAKAPAGPVTGVEWAQIGPQPQRRPTGADCCMGDGPVAGEVTDIAIDPSGASDQTIYISTNDGGIWKTTNAGSTWTPLTDGQLSLSMGSVAIDPSNTQTVYAGTGNPFDGGGEFTKGVGLYRSTDGGGTWSSVGASLFNNASIFRVRVLQDGTLLVASTNGLFRSTDGGATFGANAPNFNDGNPIFPEGCIRDIDIDTANASTVYVTRPCGANPGVYRSTDSGATFPTQILTGPGAPPQAEIAGTTNFTQSTQPDGQTMYVLIGNGVGCGTNPGPNPGDPPVPATACAQLYRSGDGGANWTNPTASAAASKNCACWYTQTLGVDPQNPLRIYAGWTKLWKSEDGGVTFGTDPVSAGEVHDDHHALEFSPPTHLNASGTTPVYDGSDGGIATSTDAGANWTNINEGVGTSLIRYIDIGLGSGDNDYTYAGMQDTGTAERRTGFPGTDWESGMGCDGFDVAVDPDDPDHALGICNGGLNATSDGGATWGGSTAGLAGATILTLEWDPSDADNAWAGQAQPGDFFSPGTKLFRSTDGAANWVEVGDFASAVTAIHVTDQSSDDVWVGLDNGTLMHSTNATAANPTFTAVTVTGAPGQEIGGIAVDSESANSVVVTYEGLAATAAGLRTRHVYATTNGGTSWTDISGTDGGANNLPDLPTHDVVIDSYTSPASIIVSNDAGVARTTDNGANWERLGAGLPLVDSTGLSLDESVNPALLRVGTYGRSVYELRAASGPLINVVSDLGFQDVKVGDSATRSIQVFNVGSTDLHVSGVTRTAGDADFTVTGPATPATIAPGGSANWTVTFNPAAAGSKTATFTVASDDPNEATVDVPASGRGVIGDIDLVGSLAFGVVPRGTTRTRPVDVFNNGDGELDVNAVTIGGGPRYSIDPAPATPATILPGSSERFLVSFSPSANDGPGNHNSTFHAASDDPDTPDATLPATAGVGVPAIQVDADLDFGFVEPGDTESGDIRVKNAGIAPLDLDSVEFIPSSDSEFKVDPNPQLPQTIAAGMTETFEAKLHPLPGAADGPRTGVLKVKSSDPADPVLEFDAEGEVGDGGTADEGGGGSLPFTGFVLLGLLAAGVALLGAGKLSARKTAAPRKRESAPLAKASSASKKAAAPRKTASAASKTMEAARRRADAASKTAEAARRKAEAAGERAEAARKKAEDARNRAEDARKKAEAARERAAAAKNKDPAE